MADITQKLGFDAAEAIDTINLLNGALRALNTAFSSAGQGLGTWNQASTIASSQLRNMKTAADAATKSLQGLLVAQNSLGRTSASLPGGVATGTGSSTQAASAAQASAVATSAAVNQVAVANQNVARTSQQAGQSMFLTFGQMGKMAQSMAFSKAISASTAALHEGVAAAMEFGIKVGEIGTISGNVAKMTQADLSGIGDRLSNMAARTGTSLKDIGQAYYEVLSNQLGKGEQAYSFMEDAIRFGIATNSSATESVNLLSSAINSYGMNVGSASNLSGKFFKAIELGRFQAKDVADIIGRVLPITAEMGIGLEEALAVLTTSTITGTRADTAITQLRGMLVSLLKPSNELKALMSQKWGVENASQAITMFGGLVPLLQELSKETGGSSDEMIKFFKNIRAFTGAMQVTRSDSRGLTSDLAELRKAGSDLANQAANLVLDTPAKRAQIAFNALKVAEKDAGDALLPLLTAGARLGEAFFVGIDVIVNKFSDANTAVKDFERGLSGITEQYKKEQEWAVRRGEVNAAVYKRWAQAAEVAFAQERTLRKTNEEDETRSQRAMGNAMLKRLRDGVEASRSLSNHLNSIVAKSEMDRTKLDVAAINLRQQAEDRAFQIKLTQYSKEQQEFLKLKRGKELISRGSSGLSGTTDTDELARRQQLIEAGQQLIRQVTDEAVARNASGGTIRASQEAEKAGEQALLDMTKQRARADQERARLAETYAGTALDVTAKMIEATKMQEEALKTKGRNPEQQAAMQTKVNKSLDEYAASLRRVASINPQDAKTLGIEKEVYEARARLKEIPNMKLKVDLVYKEEMADLAKDWSNIGTAAQGALVRVGTLDTGDPLGSLSNGVANATNRLQKLENELPSLTSRLSEVQDGGKLASGELEKLGGSFQNSVTLLSKKGQWTAGGDALAQYRRDLKAFISEAKIAATMDLTSPAGLRQLETLQKIRASLTKSGGEGGGGLSGQELSRTDLILKGVQANWERMSLSDKTPFSRAVAEAAELRSALPLLERGFKALKAGVGADTLQLPSTWRDMSNTMQQIPAISATITTAGTNLDTSAKSAKNSMIAGASAVTMSASALNGALARLTGYKALGGMIYRATGGSVSRGTDSRLVNLTPGEFVMNAGASRQYYSQLVAMNAGSGLHRSQGGSITNFGDINVNVAGQKSEQQTARAIATGLRRELRKGTSKL
jgi:TP901 family phage tail tape measure protein